MMVSTLDSSKRNFSAKENRSKTKTKTDRQFYDFD